MPQEFDTTSSPTTIYQRRNVHKVSVVNEMDNTSTDGWEYEERELTKEEYLEIYSAMLEDKLQKSESNIADIEDYICSIDINRG